MQHVSLGRIDVNTTTERATTERHSDGTADGSIQVSSNGTIHNVPPPCQPVQPDSTFNPSVCKGSVHSKRIPSQSRRKHFQANFFHFRSDFVGFGILSAASFPKSSLERISILSFSFDCTCTLNESEL